MRNIVIGFFFIFMNFICLAQPNSGRIIVHIENFPSDSGVVRSHLFNNAKLFPIESKKAIMKLKGMIKNNKATLIYDNVPFGKYALTVHHDLNNNGIMDRNFIGYPKEGFGLSRNPTILLSVPDFEECEFELNSSIKTLHVVLKFV